MREGLRAVDRVDDPPATRLARLLRLFLAQNPVAGVSELELLTDQSLSLPVCLGHRRAVLLPVDGEPDRAEIAQRHLTRLAGQVEGLLQEVGEGVGLHGVWFLGGVHRGRPPHRRP